MPEQIAAMSDDLGLTHDLHAYVFAVPVTNVFSV